MANIFNGPVTGGFAAAGTSDALIITAGARGFNVSLWGVFVADVQLERSFDAGSTWLPLTAAGYRIGVWSAPASEIFNEPEAGVLYRLNCTARVSGTVNYRVSQ